MEFRYASPQGEITVQLEPSEHGYSVVVLRPDREPVTYKVDLRRPEPGRVLLCFDDHHVSAYVARDGHMRYVALYGESWRLEPPKPRGRGASETGGGLSASMPGKVLDVLVSEGEEVKAGTPLVLLEAMKMELRIVAPQDGVVHRLRVQPGAVVAQGETLVELR